MHKTELADGEEIVHYTLEEFITTTRPEDGLGHIKITDMTTGEVTSDIKFSEVVCDFCNAEITQPEEDPEREVVHVNGSYALCDSCYEDIEDNVEAAPGDTVDEDISQEVVHTYGE